MGACELCGWEMYGGTRTCGAELCDVCYSGEIAKRVAPVGFHLETNLKRSATRDSAGSKKYSVRRTQSGRVMLAQPAPVATFSREGLGTKLRKFLGMGPDELQLGDSAQGDHRGASYGPSDGPRAPAR